MPNGLLLKRLATTLRHLQFYQIASDGIFRIEEKNSNTFLGDKQVWQEL